MKNLQYQNQAALLIRVIPIIATEKCFALKGGTAINLFIRNMPRLSVDIDLTYLPLESRDETLSSISKALNRIKLTVEKVLPNSRARSVLLNKTKFSIKLTIATKDAQIKIEPNLIIRGTVYPPKDKTLVPFAQDLFQASARINTCSTPDLYGGKICAALDRQHPRDLFDIQILMNAEGITPEIRKSFIVYLLSHNRPIAELLSPINKDITPAFEREFAGMTREPTDIKTLVQLQHSLAGTLLSSLNDTEKSFILSVKKGVPDWDKIGIDNIREFPAIKWKLQNILSMDKLKHLAAIAKLEHILTAV